MRSIISALVLSSIALSAQTTLAADQLTDNEKAPAPRGGVTEAEEEEFAEQEGLRNAGIAFVAVIGPLLTVGTLVFVAWAAVAPDSSYKPAIALSITTVVFVVAGIPMWIAGARGMKEHASLDFEPPPSPPRVQVVLTLDREGAPSGAGIGWLF